MPCVWTAAVKGLGGLEGIPPCLPTTSVKKNLRAQMGAMGAILAAMVSWKCV